MKIMLLALGLTGMFAAAQEKTIEVSPKQAETYAPQRKDPQQTRNEQTTQISTNSANGAPAANYKGSNTVDEDLRQRVLVSLSTGSIGTQGVLHVPHIAVPKLYPVEKFKDYSLPEAEQGHHWTIFAEACINGGKPGANFDYSGPLTEAVLLGSVAVRYPQTTLEWNGAKLAFNNETSANQYLRRTYRKGWEVAGL